MNSQARAGPEDAGLSLGGTQASKQGSSPGPSTALTSVDAQQEAHHLPREPPHLPDFEPKAYFRASPFAAPAPISLWSSSCLLEVRLKARTGAVERTELF